MREALVLLQFTISAAVIASTVLMAAQLRYVSSKSLGFQKENRLIVKLRGGSAVEKLETLRKELRKNSHILGVSQIAGDRGHRAGDEHGAGADGGGRDGAHGDAQPMPVGEDLVPVLGIKLKSGRDFTARLRHRLRA